jgi:hypothetical protein
MDPISTALTAAWLDAVRRVQSDRVQHLEEVMPQSQPGHDERTLTDVIASGLESGGAAPQASPENQTADGDTDNDRNPFPKRVLDVLV